MNKKTVTLSIAGLILVGLVGMFADYLYNLHKEYQKYRDIEVKSTQRVITIPEPSVYVTPTDIDVWRQKSPKDQITVGVDQCEYTKQFHLCLQTSKTKTDGVDYGNANFNFVIESCRTAAKDLSVRSIEIISEGCRGQ